MSLILKGIDLPKEKDEALLLLILGDGTVAEKIGSDRYEETTDTQAIQIPKGHGRIIDESKIYCVDHDEYETPSVFETDAPTILESEE